MLWNYGIKIELILNRIQYVRCHSKGVRCTWKIIINNNFRLWKKININDTRE